MSVEITKIYEFKMFVGDIMDFVVAEQARKNYSNSADQEANAALAYEYSITEDDAPWFKEYLRQGLSKICTKLTPLQKYLEDCYQVDDLVATIRFRLSVLYKTQRLEDVIREAIGNFICYRWYLMKNRPDFAAIYKPMFDENLDELRSISVRGIYNRDTAVRPYDMGFGAVMPEPYETADILIRDIRWKNANSDLYDMLNGKKHLPSEKSGESKSVELPGVTILGPKDIHLADGDALPLMRKNDRGMVIPRNTEHEVVIVLNNESVISNQE